MIAVIGIGQSLRGDDAAGLEAVRVWQTKYSSSTDDSFVVVHLTENPGLGLLNLLCGVDTAILVDAVQSGVNPGTLHRINESAIDSFTNGSDSAHGFGVGETLVLGRSVDPHSLPEEIVVIGIEVGQTDIGKGLSPEVEAVLPEAAILIEEEINRIKRLS
jgi:hydrogenase maturation protease